MIHDYLIIGAGISGAAAAYELAASGSVLVVEAESSPGYHSTGRSAALYTPNYGNHLVRKINQSSHAFLSSPPAGFTEHALLKPRGMMTVVQHDQTGKFESLLAAGGSAVVALDARQTHALAPFLCVKQLAGSVYEKEVSDIDVDALHQGFLRGLKQRGGLLIKEARVISLERIAEGWRVNTVDQHIKARIVINAAGAWADQVGAMAGACPIGLVPRRRTAMLVDGPAGVDLDQVPAIDFAGVENYIKPEAGQLMISPGDETPQVPQDIQPDDMDIAHLVDWFEKQTDIEVERVKHSWAGLRCFVADGAPVVGFDSSAENFFWLAGQGGYGIMMSCALARATAALITHGKLPADFIDAGIARRDLSVQRLSA